VNRVVVTGLGVCAAPGKNAADFALGLTADKSAIGPLVNIRTEGLTTLIAAQVRDFDPAAYFQSNLLGLLDRCSQFALVAAREAIAQSGLNFREGGLGARTAAILGSGAGGQTTQDENYFRVYAEHAKRLHPFTIPRLMINAPCSHISMENGITGTSFVIASACSSANHAIGTAFQMVRAGMVDAAVTGGTEAVLTFGTIRGWEALRVMAPDTCRPFSVDRKGMVLGEGAAVMVLERYDNAMKRGAEILAEIVGFGATSDAGDIVMPAVEGAAGAIAACLNDAGLNPSDVDYINAHGTGTAANDVTETKAIHVVFGDHAKKLAVSSTKSIHGHTLGAAGAVELAATIQAMRGGFIPPTLNFTKADPQCDLDYVPNETRAKRIDVAISNSFAFGGHNAVVAVRRA
jgi:nodulation protein E